MRDMCVSAPDLSSAGGTYCYIEPLVENGALVTCRQIIAKAIVFGLEFPIRAVRRGYFWFTSGFLWMFRRGAGLGIVMPMGAVFGLISSRNKKSGDGSPGEQGGLHPTRSRKFSRRAMMMEAGLLCWCLVCAAHTLEPFGIGLVF